MLDLPKHALAIFVSDVHLCHSPPSARSDEPSWYKAMARPWLELKRVRDELRVDKVFIAGDVFDHWKNNVNFELLTFTIDLFQACLPCGVSAIPGQHDLPYHDLGKMDRSPYGSLSHTMSMRHLEHPEEFHGFIVYPFPWGSEITPAPPDPEGRLKVALCHAYVWTGSHRHAKAVDGEISQYRDALEGYDLAVFGDNHSHFVAKSGDTTVLNCGTMYRRRSDEKDYVPKYGILWSDGELEVREFDVSEDVLTEKKEELEIRDTLDFNVKQFVSELKDGNDKALDFKDALVVMMDQQGVSQSVRDMVLSVL